jgi:hypothetical protein
VQVVFNSLLFHDMASTSCCNVYARRSVRASVLPDQQSTRLLGSLTLVISESSLTL